MPVLLAFKYSLIGNFYQLVNAKAPASAGASTRLRDLGELGAGFRNLPASDDFLDAGDRPAPSLCQLRDTGARLMLAVHAPPDFVREDSRQALVGILRTPPCVELMPAVITQDCQIVALRQRLPRELPKKLLSGFRMGECDGE